MEIKQKDMELTTTLDKLLDFVLLQLWHADHWDKNLRNDTDFKKEFVDDNVKQFRSQAFGVVFFIYTNMIASNEFKNYKGLHIPKNIIDLLKLRELIYKHPN